MSLKKNIIKHIVEDGKLLYVGEKCAINCEEK